MLNEVPRHEDASFAYRSTSLLRRMGDWRKNSTNI